MVRRKFLNAAGIAAALIPLALISCSDDTNNGGAGGSGGTGGTGGTGGSGGSAGAPAKDGGTSDAPPSADSGGNDSAPDQISDAGPSLPDGAIPPSGTQLVPGNISLAGVTSDNYAVYADNNASTLNAISLAGGTPASLGSLGGRVAVKGSAVVTWTGTGVAPLSVWTAAHGQKMLSMSSYVSGTRVAVSPDGEHILYFDGVDTGRTVGNLFIANTDGTGQKELAASVVLNDTSCTPVFAFGGNAAAAATFCIAASTPDAGTSDAATSDAGTSDVGTSDAGTTDGANPDAGSPLRAVVQSYSGASWTATTIASNVQPRVAIAPTGTTVLVSTPAALLAYPVAGGAATIIDTAGGSGMFTNDGLSVIYTTPANALKRSTVASPSPITLAASGIAGLRVKSPDEKWLLGYTTIDTTQDLSDLYLASATVAGTPTTLSAANSAGLFGSDGFTADSSHAIYYTDITSVGVGTFFAVAATGGTPVTLGTNVWLHYAGTGSKVAFNDNYDDAIGTADILVADTAQTAPAKLVVSLADADFFISGTKDKIVYSWSFLTGSMAGLWVTPIP